METKNKNKELEGELRKLLFGFISTTFGVLLALLINQGLAKKNDSKNYITILKGIESELQTNMFVLEDSFKPNYNVTVIYRSLNADF